MVKGHFFLFKGDSDIYCCNSRLQKSELPLLGINLTFLTCLSELGQFLMLCMHIKAFHVGVPHKLSLLRKQYRISKGRITVKRAIRKCMIFQQTVQIARFFSKPFKLLIFQQTVQIARCAFFTVGNVRNTAPVCIHGIGLQGTN